MLGARNENRLMTAIILDQLKELTHPVGFLWFLLLLVFLRFLIKKEKMNALLTGLLAALLFAMGNDRIAQALLATLERPYANMDVSERADDLPELDAVVVLGGGHVPSKHDWLGLDFSSDADRLLTGLEIMRRGKAHRLLLPGFKDREGDSLTDTISHHAGKLMDVWGIDSDRVLTMDICRNTRDEARQAQQFADENDWKSIYLVTSAYHMKRAKAAFEKLGLQVTPVPCDFQVVGNYQSRPGFQFVPEIEPLEMFHLFIHEKVGWVVYRLRDWI